MSLLGNLRDLVGDLPDDGRACPPPEPPPASSLPASSPTRPGYAGAQSPSTRCSMSSLWPTARMVSSLDTTVSFVA
jgi:hypothetical protein